MLPTSWPPCIILSPRLSWTAGVALQGEKASLAKQEGKKEGGAEVMHCLPCQVHALLHCYVRIARRQFGVLCRPYLYSSGTWQHPAVFAGSNFLTIGGQASCSANLQLNQDWAIASLLVRCCLTTRFAARRVLDSHSTVASAAELSIACTCCSLVFPRHALLSMLQRFSNDTCMCWAAGECAHFQESGNSGLNTPQMTLALPSHLAQPKASVTTADCIAVWLP